MFFLLKKIPKNLFLLTSLLFIISCSHSPTSVALQPELLIKENDKSLHSKLTWNMDSQDQRIAHYLIEISSGDGVATLVNESQNSRMLIEKTVRNQWQEQGLIFTSNSSYKIDLQIIKLLAQVKQNTFSFDLDSTIIIKVELRSEKKTFTKIFTAHLTEEAPFSADVKKITKQLNAQLSQLLTEIVQDPELTVKLKQF